MCLPKKSLLLLTLLVPSSLFAAKQTALSATYQIPFPSRYGDNAFQLPSLTLENKSGVRHIVFDFPLDLSVGQTEVVSLSEVKTQATSPFISFKGDAGELATCQFTAKTATCLLHYPVAKLADSEIKDYFGAAYADTGMASRKSNMAQLYRNEPAGVLTFKLP